MITYFYWWYIEEPIFLWQAINIISQKIFANFSVILLLRTLFDPWKRDIAYVENASLDIRFRIWVDNLISRLIGFLVRLVTIFAGLLVTVSSFSVMFIGLICWYILPAIIVFLLIHGLKGTLYGSF